MLKNIPLRTMPEMRNRNERSSNGSCGQKPLPVWRMPPEHNGILIAWWDKLDANRERRERYHELSRSGDDVPFDYGASANELFFPDTLNDVLEKQIRKGDFIDAIFYCPYDIHELVTEEYLSEILLELKEDHKELLFLWSVRLFSSTRIAAIRQQSDRNIRKVRNTMMKKIRKELLSALTDKAEKQQPMTLMEKAFLSDNGKAVDTEAQK